MKAKRIFFFTIYLTLMSCSSAVVTKDGEKMSEDDVIELENADQVFNLVIIVETSMRGLKLKVNDRNTLFFDGILDHCPMFNTGVCRVFTTDNRDLQRVT